MVVSAPSPTRARRNAVTEPGDLFGPDGVLTIPCGRHEEGASLRIGLMGTRGVPARYGGFETAVEEIGKRLAQWGHRVTVYCRSLDSNRDRQVSEYMGMRLVTMPFLPVKQFETLSHTYMSIMDELKRKDRDDVVVVFNAANGYLLPLLRKAGIPVAVNTDGLEWMRGKWGPAGRRYYRMAESACVRYADRLISDSRGIQEYYTSRSIRRTRHGGPQLPPPRRAGPRTVRLPLGRRAPRAREQRRHDRRGIPGQHLTPPACDRRG
jgi:hypothetical protein